MGIIDSDAPKWVPIGKHGGRITEDYSHQEIHNGHVFRCGLYSTIGAGSVLSVMVTTPSTENIHMTQAINTNGPGVGSFYEDVVASSGSALTARNALRSSTITSESILVGNPTITTVGTRIGVSVIGSTGFKETSGGNAISEEWILKGSTNYMVRFESDAASCRTIIKMLWVED